MNTRQKRHTSSAMDDMVFSMVTSARADHFAKLRDTLTFTELQLIVREIVNFVHEKNDAYDRATPGKPVNG